MAAFTTTLRAPSTNSLTVAPLSYQQLDILHSLRGFCALYVVVFHAKFILWAGGRQLLVAYPRTTWSALDYLSFGLNMLSSAGYEMVIFFFVLSGFFIRYAQHKKYRAAGSFYLNRLVRIYPPFLVSLVLAVGALTLLATQVPQALTTQAGRELNTTLAEAWAELQSLNLTETFRTLLFLRVKQHFLGDNVVYWSLLPEAIFYLLVPIAFWQVRWYYAISSILFILGLYCDWQGIMLNNITRYALTYNMYFAAGAGLYDIVVTTSWLGWVRRQPPWLTLPGLLGLLGLLIAVTLLKLHIVPNVLAGILAILTVSVLLAGQVPARNILVRIMHKIGEFSFSLYLYHYPLLLVVYAALVSYTGKLFIYASMYWLALPLIIIICFGLYWVTERLSVRYFRK